MNQEIGSIMGYIHSKWPIKMYTQRLPQGFEVPSLYFPVPSVVQDNDTVSTYLKTYTLPIKATAKSSLEAYSTVQEIADSIRDNRYLIPLLELTGALTGSYLRIKAMEEIITEDGMAQLTVTWSSRYSYERQEYGLMGNLHLNNEVKK